jgi:hypothetical protein
MSDKTLELHFEGTQSPELFMTQFRSGCANPARVSVRGKTSGAYLRAGSFHFSAAVRAMCVICAKTVIASRSFHSPPVLLGCQGSLAVSLDYALTKGPGWVYDMFGFDSAGRALAPRLFCRTNSHRKRPGPVVVSVNARALPPGNIHILWGGRELLELEDLQKLLSLLLLQEDSNESSHNDAPYPCDLVA